MATYWGFASLILAVSCFGLGTLADTPANCSYSDVEGGWYFYENDRGHDNTLNCSFQEGYKLERYFHLNFPNIAVDEYGNEGFWTLIYNQGFEVVLDGRKYFAFLLYYGQVSQCNATKIGWSHNVNGADWACFMAFKEYKKQAGQSTKAQEASKPRMLAAARDNAAATPNSPYKVQYKDTRVAATKNTLVDKNRIYKHNADFIRKINEAQGSWVAKKYISYENMTLNDLFRRAGGKKSKLLGIPKPAPRSLENAKLAAVLPDAFDWRVKDGRNFVSPVRDQGNCGSCYAFASMAMLEARQRIYTNLTIQNVYSPQDVVECSEYSQGCDGGFPYLIAGKYTEDFGAVQESCNPYTGQQMACSTATSCPRQYGYDYRYVGGFYGACNEDAMKLALVQNGPVAVAFEVYDDFLHYSGGVYHHTFLEDHFNPFEITNHAVLLVGYGADPVAGPYWSVKNSWSTAWGENGYFRIRRGIDECAIESIAVEALPVV